MELELLCKNHTPADRSPALYRTSRGTFVIQGWKVSDEVRGKAKAFRKEEEDVIEVPAELIRMIVDQAGASQ